MGSYTLLEVSHAPTLPIYKCGVLPQGMFSLMTENRCVDVEMETFLTSNCGLITSAHLYCLAGPKSFWETLSRRNAGGNDDVNVYYMHAGVCRLCLCKMCVHLILCDLQVSDIYCIVVITHTNKNTS